MSGVGNPVGLLQTIRDFREYRQQKALARMRHEGGYGGQGWGSTWATLFGWPYAGTKINYAQEVGDLRNSTLIQAAISWASRGLASARGHIVKLDADNRETEVKNHQITQLLRRPNPYYSGNALLAGLALSRIIAGEGYIIKAKGRMRFEGVSIPGPVNELWWEPHWTIRPRWPMDGSEFISYYEIYRNGNWSRIERDDVIFIADQIDTDTRRGCNGTSSLLREFYTDNQAAQVSALLMKKGIVPPLLFKVGQGETFMPPDKFTEFKADTTRKLQGDSAMEPLFLNGPGNVEKLGFEYDKMGLSDVRSIPEQRFCSVMGISSISLMLGAGKEMSTYSNVEQYLRNDYRSYIVPLHKTIAEELERSLLPEFGETDGLAVRWDYSQAPLMQSDKKVDAEIATMLFEKGVLKRSEAREYVGYEFDEEDEIYVSDVAGSIGDKLLADMERRTPPITDDDTDSDGDDDMSMDDEKPNGQTRSFVPLGAPTTPGWGEKF